MRKSLIFSLILFAQAVLASTHSHTISERTRALIPVKLSPAIIEMQQHRSFLLNISTRSLAVDNIPSQINLGMNAVPMFDQGLFPACVTFAVTAALDAAINKGDYISQICLLQLGNSLADNSYWPRMWEGSSVRILLDYIAHYGIIPTADQNKGYCNKITKYPQTNDKSIMKYKMSVSGYHARSEDILKKFKIEPQVLFSFAHTYSEDDSPDRMLTIGNNSDGWITPIESFNAVKKSLAEGNRVILEFLFHARLAREGSTTVDKDTWFASNELKSLFSSEPYFTEANKWYSHDLVVYGYNDNIIVKNAKGESQRGVFYVRNSWGEDMVEYMTYDFFKLMAIEGTSINTPLNAH